MLLKFHVAWPANDRNGHPEGRDTVTVELPWLEVDATHGEAFRLLIADCYGTNDVLLEDAFLLSKREVRL